MRLINLCLSLIVCVSAEAQSIIIGPYLQNIKENSATIVWETDIPTSGRLLILEKSFQKTIRFQNTSTRHEVKVKGLYPNTFYRYLLSPREGENKRGHFRTAPTPQNFRHLKVAALGDSGTGLDDQYNVANEIKNWSPDLILHTGDIVYESGARDDYKPKFFEPYKSLLRNIPLYPAIGNHDFLNGGVFDEIFVLPKNRSGSGIERYYSFDRGIAHFTVLDTNQDFSEDSAQYQWAENDLSKAQKTSKWLVVSFHHTVYSAGLHGDTDEIKTRLLPLFERHKVNIVLYGHDHAYARSFPISRTDNHEITFILTGGGGRSLYQSQGDNSNLIVYEPRFHFLALTFSRARIRGKAIDKNGEIFDRFQIQ